MFVPCAWCSVSREALGDLPGRSPALGGNFAKIYRVDLPALRLVLGVTQPLEDLLGRSSAPGSRLAKIYRVDLRAPGLVLGVTRPGGRPTG